MYTYISLIVFITIAMVDGTRFSDRVSFDMNRNSSMIKTSEVGLDVCQDCIKEFVSVINVLLNLILDEGIIGSCGDLCGALANKTNSTETGDVCLFLYNAVGIVEFIKILEHTDLDPIWYCQIVELCPSNIKILFTLII